MARNGQLLTRGGAGAAFVVGTLTYGAGGWPFTLVLLAFFIPSVGLSRVGRARKKRLVDIGKGGARDGWQVLANGGIATLCAVVAGLGSSGYLAPLVGRVPAPLIDPRLWTCAFAGAYAAATADTWGTEIGTLARGTPRSILTLRPIATGLSGGVTVWGTVAEMLGSAWLSVATVLSLRDFVPFLGPIALAGFAGALADSLLGATLQELRRCPVCNRTCETDPHLCGSSTDLVRGIRGFSNDVVNGMATLVGGTTAYASALIAVAFGGGW